MARVEVRSEITGTVWKIPVSAQDSVQEGDDIAILEAMKMEIPVVAPATGRVVSVELAEGAPVAEGDLIAVIEVGA